MRRTLIVMVKAPSAGRVKTRLGRDIGNVAAAWWYRHQVTGLLRRVRDRRWQTVLAVAPDVACTSRFWPIGLPRWPQGRGNLGRRMARMIRRAAPGPVCLVGSDIPALDRAHVARAFDLLGRQDMVFGPAEDGGYWLWGVHHPQNLPLDPLAGVRWSTPHALTDSVVALRGQRIAFADQLRDVDRATDLRGSGRFWS